MDEIVKQLAAAFLALIGALPFLYQAWRDRRTREKLQTLARRALDGWSQAMILLNRYLIIESDVDERIKAEYDDLETRYQRVWNEYAGEEKEK